MAPHTLKAPDYQALLDLVAEVSACASNSELQRVSILGIRKLVDCDSVSYNDFDLVTGENTMDLEPKNEFYFSHRSLFAKYRSQHPVINYMQRTGDGSAWKITDFMSQQAFRKLELYREVYSFVDTEYQMAISFLPQARRLIGFACNRSKSRRDFGENARAKLNLLRPHLLNAWRHIERIEAAQRNAAKADGDGADASAPFLTARERQVLSWLEEGRTNAQIADSLGLSALTIKSHLQRIYRKLQCSNRTHAIKTARSLRLL